MECSERAPCFLKVRERPLLTAGLLIGLMTFAGDEHEISGLRRTNGVADRGATVEFKEGLGPILQGPSQDRLGNRARILGARVVVDAYRGG